MIILEMTRSSHQLTHPIWLYIQFLLVTQEKQRKQSIAHVDRTATCAYISGTIQVVCICTVRSPESNRNLITSDFTAHREALETAP
jgi:hypothetical protein